MANCKRSDDREDEHVEFVVISTEPTLERIRAWEQFWASFRERVRKEAGLGAPSVIRSN